MNREEAVMLCRYVKACCPQQAIDQYTPDAWADHLEDIPYEDAKAAAKVITGRQPFVQIADLKSEVKKIRDKRIADAGNLTPPPDAREGDAHREWLRDARRKIANGEQVLVDLGELKPRHLPDLRALMPSPPSTHPEPGEDGTAETTPATTRVQPVRAAIAARKEDA